MWKKKQAEAVETLERERRTAELRWRGLEIRALRAILDLVTRQKEMRQRPLMRPPAPVATQPQSSAAPRPGAGV